MEIQVKARHQYLAAMMPAAMLLTPAALLPETGWSQQLEEVTVTARRREENLQEIPVSVAAFDADFIEKNGLTSTKEVVKLVPGVQFDQGFSAADTRISIRGVNNSRGRASVATLVDGIDISGENVTAGGGSSLLNINLLDLERVEVIKGPQSALYGRNAFAGAINYVTKQPNMDAFESEVSGEVAENETYSLRSSLSGPIIDNTLAIRLNAAYATTDGPFKNTKSDQRTSSNGEPIDYGNRQKLNGAESKGARLAVLWTPTDTLDVTAAVTVAKEESDPRAVVKVGNANTFYLDGDRLAGVTTPSFDIQGQQDYGQWLGTVGSVSESDVKLSSQGDGSTFNGSDDDRWGISLKVDWELGSVRFKSATSFLDNDAELNEDADFQTGIGTEVFGIGFSLANDYTDKTETKQFTQDFTIESNDWDRGFWLAGVQYFNEDVDNWDSSLGWYNDPAAAAFLPCGTELGEFSCSYEQALAGGDPAKYIERQTDSYSLYGMLSYDLTDKLSAAVEMRYVQDRIEVTTNTVSDRVGQYLFHIPPDGGFGADVPVTDSQRTTDLNPRFTVDYTFTDEFMVYASAAKGTKPGGYGTAQMSVPTIARMDAETLWGYELGTKTSWLDQTLLFNTALFYNDYKDRQVGVTVEDPLTGFSGAGIVNAGKAQTKGVEVELQWLASEYLTLGLGYAYTDAEWKDFDYDEIRADTPAGGATDKDRAICQDANGDCSDAEVAGIPENALTLSANWTQPIGAGDMEWFTSANAAYTDERAVYDRVDTAFIDSFWRVDAQLGLQTEAWSALVYATNLFDDDTVTWGQGYQDFRDGLYAGQGGEPRDESVMAFVPDPRIIGVRATYRFGD